MTFSFLNEGDVDKIVEFYRHNFLDGWSRDMLISAFKSGRFYCLTAEDDSGIICLVCYSVAIDEADVEGIVTRADKRKQGLAKTLYLKAQEHLENLSVKKVFLEVRESNLSAKNLYYKCGFKDLSVRKNYYADGENAVVMEKEL